MQRSVTLKSYAKVNYTLDILSQRPDGYHNVATVMQTACPRAAGANPHAATSAPLADQPPSYARTAPSAT